MLHGVDRVEQIFNRPHNEEFFDAVDLLDDLAPPETVLEPASGFVFSDKDL
jgi:hypothetical protein